MARVTRPSRSVLSRLVQAPRFWWHMVWTADDVAVGWPWPASWCSRAGYATAVVIKAIRWRLPREHQLSGPRRTFRRRV